VYFCSFGGGSKTQTANYVKGWRHDAGNSLIYYVTCVLSCVYALPFVAGRFALFVSWLLVKFVGRPSEVVSLYAGNLLPFNLCIGVIAGLLSYPLWRSRLSLWVWLPSTIILAYQMYVLPSSILAGRKDLVSHFIAWGCDEVNIKHPYISVKCADQVIYSLPFYAALGSSLGCFIRRLYETRSVRAPEARC